MKVLVAPNSFKECASSIELASLISGELQKRNILETVIFPVSDGGDDFLEVYKRNFSCDSLSLETSKCYNSESVTIPLAYDPALSSFVLESAKVIGLNTIPQKFRDPLKLNSANFGTLLKDLINNYRAKKAIIGLGGTGTTDLGLGLCKPFGLRLYDKQNNELEIIPANYLEVEKIDLPVKSNIQIEAVADVAVPIYGKQGAAFTFAGQKGASEEDILIIDKGFRKIVDVLEKEHNLNFRNKKFGAAGGLALGLSLISNLVLISSQEFLNKRLNIHEKIKECDLIITAEGRFDAQSMMKKAAGVIVNEALKQQKQVVIITGESLVDFTTYKNPPYVLELIKLLGSKEKALTEYKKGITLAIEKLSNIFPALRN